MAMRPYFEVDLDQNGLKQYRRYSLPKQADSPQD
jgi:hypothetical protein